MNDISPINNFNETSNIFISSIINLGNDNKNLNRTIKFNGENNIIEGNKMKLNSNSDFVIINKTDIYYFQLYFLIENNENVIDNIGVVMKLNDNKIPCLGSILNNVKSNSIESKTNITKCKFTKGDKIKLIFNYKKNEYFNSQAKITINFLMASK